MKELREGYVEHIRFRNEDNGYTVFDLSTAGGEEVCAGNIPSVHEGEYIEAEGEEVIHPVYGPQFHISSVRTKAPEDEVAMLRYLGSGAIKGVGQTLAGRIMDRFGADSVRIIEEEPERLAEIKGISLRKAQEIGEQLAERSQMQSAMLFLAKYGISLSLAIRIYEKYGDSIYRILKENPYQLAEDMAGVGFRTADEIARRAGIRMDSEYRIRSGLLYVLAQAEAQGHLFLPKEELLARTEELLETELDGMDKVLTDLIIEKKLVNRPQTDREGWSREAIYAARAYYTELSAARMLCDLNIETGEDKEEVLSQIRRVEKADHLDLDELQREAVLRAATNGIFILTGGPGTGKTTAINTMIRYFTSIGSEIACAAPTGRAAKRMTETTGHPASTIHRLLELSGMSEEGGSVRFERNGDHPLEADVIIIDEMSMVDTYLLHALLSAVLPGTRLILVGDVDQLPSVGPGSVLGDLLAADCFPTVRLTQIFRQAAESDIIVNAHRINAGEDVRPDNKSRDFFFLQRDNAAVIQRLILTLVSEKLPPYVQAEPMDVQVLTPMRKGELGVERLNEILQRYLNPPSPSKEEKEVSQGLFREGDKVMQIRNDYQLEWEIRGKYDIVGQRGLGVFNGDMGIIRKITHGDESLVVEFEEGKLVTYSFRQLDELELAYATTIHKAQGSEYPAVVIPLLSGPRMLMTRKLLYTAVTRARSCVVLAGSPETFRQMIQNKVEDERYTGLADRIADCLSF